MLLSGPGHPVQAGETKSLPSRWATEHQKLAKSELRCAVCVKYPEFPRLTVKKKKDVKYPLLYTDHMLRYTSFGYMGLKKKMFFKIMFPVS